MFDQNYSKYTSNRSKEISSSQIQNTKIQNVTLPRNELKLHTPLHIMQPLQPPAKIIEICKDYQKKQAQTNRSKKSQLNQNSQENYKALYQEKCSELILQISKNNNLEMALRQLKEHNKALEIQIKKIQQDKWDKCSTFRQSEARKRSKSSKKSTPTIEVKVPNSFDDRYSAYLPKLQTKREQWQQILISYRQQIAAYKQEIIRLNAQLLRLRNKIEEFKFKPQAQRQKFEPLLQIQSQSKHINSPQTYMSSLPELQPTKHPFISDFSPATNRQANTVKKDKVQASQLQFEMKKMKNELLYKELLFNQLRDQNKKQNHTLQKHLKLTVQQSKKIAEQTSQIVNLLKNEIVELWQQLNLQKNKNQQLKQQIQRFQPKSVEFKAKTAAPSIELLNKNSSLVAMLQIRRNQKIE